MSYTQKHPNAIIVGPMSFTLPTAGGRWEAFTQLNKEIVAKCLEYQRKDRMLHFTYKDHFLGNSTLSVVYEVIALPIDPALELYQEA